MKTLLKGMRKENKRLKQSFEESKWSAIDSSCNAFSTLSPGLVLLFIVIILYTLSRYSSHFVQVGVSSLFTYTSMSTWLAFVLSIFY